jgi:hypothetical protein
VHGNVAAHQAAQPDGPDPVVSSCAESPSAAGLNLQQLAHHEEDGNRACGQQSTACHGEWKETPNPTQEAEPGTGNQNVAPCDQPCISAVHEEPTTGVEPLPSGGGAHVVAPHDLETRVPTVLAEPRQEKGQHPSERAGDHAGACGDEPCSRAVAKAPSPQHRTPSSGRQAPYNDEPCNPATRSGPTCNEGLHVAACTEDHIAAHPNEHETCSSAAPTAPPLEEWKPPIAGDQHVVSPSNDATCTSPVPKAPATGVNSPALGQDRVSPCSVPTCSSAEPGAPKTREVIPPASVDMGHGAPYIQQFCSLAGPIASIPSEVPPQAAVGMDRVARHVSQPGSPAAAQEFSLRDEPHSACTKSDGREMDDKHQRRASPRAHQESASQAPEILREDGPQVAANLLKGRRMAEAHGIAMRTSPPATIDIEAFPSPQASAATPTEAIDMTSMRHATPETIIQSPPRTGLPPSILTGQRPNVVSLPPPLVGAAPQENMSVGVQDVAPEPAGNPLVFTPPPQLAPIAACFGDKCLLHFELYDFTLRCTPSRTELSSLQQTLSDVRSLVISARVSEQPGGVAVLHVQCRHCVCTTLH